MLYTKCINTRAARCSESGFTLVELSIVLVIIGLIVASVLVGQDLVRAAELRATVTQYEQYQAAVKTFKGKYNGLPGDITGNTSYGWGAGDGDASGLLDAGACTGGPPCTNNGLHDENSYFWNNLGASGAALISGTYGGAAVTTANIASELPVAKAGNYWGVYGSSGVNYYLLGVVSPSANYEFDTSNTLLPIDAKSIDAKIDDGRPGRGVVQAFGTGDNSPETAAGIANNTTPDDSDNTCTYVSGGVSTTDASYNIAETSVSNGCTLRLRMD